MRQHRRSVLAASVVTAALTLAACGSTTPQSEDDPSVSHPTASSSAAPSMSTPSTEPDTSTPSSTADEVAGTTVHFTAGSTVVTVTIAEDNATTRDFVSMLPMTLEFKDYHGQEKISYPPRPFDYTGTPGITPQVGDLFSYKPWANLGFFYNVDGLGHSNDLVRIGTTTDLDKIKDLDGQQVTIQVAG